MIVTNIQFLFEACSGITDLFFETFVLRDGMFQTTIISVLLALIVITPLFVWVLRKVKPH